MSIKTCRTLQIISFVLFTLALLSALLAIPFQKPILSIYTSDPEILSRFNFPWGALLKTLLLFTLALIYLILVFQRMSPGGSRATVIIFAILTGFQLALVIPLLDVLVTSLVGQEGQMAMVHYNYLNSAVTFVTAFLLVPAEILMFLSMGGFFGKDTRA